MCLHPNFEHVIAGWMIELLGSAIQRCSYKKVFCKYAANLQENTHAEV